MGDYFQHIVDRDATEDEAVALAQRILDWLVDERIVLPSTRDCVLSGDGQGYPPGPSYAKAIGHPDDTLLELATNGMRIRTGRNVFHSGQGGFELVCEACGHRFSWSDNWGRAVGEWDTRKGPGLLSCPSCAATKSIAEWEHDPPWGFGNLAFTFWNWPPLRIGSSGSSADALAIESSALRENSEAASASDAPCWRLQ